MANKLEKNTVPSGHSLSDFKCFGPVASRDGQFAGTKLADLGCFTQEGKDTNKYYHGAVVQSTINNGWYVYFEYGKTGANTVGFQFLECSSESEAQSEYEKQLHSKNDKRGIWVSHAVLGNILQAKTGKDCYLVRQQIVRSVGLPDARNISSANKISTVVAPVTGKIMDKETVALLKDLNATTLSYTRNSLVNSTVPSQEAIDEARLILKTAANSISNNISERDKKELINLTNMLYSRIPKKKNRSDTDWILSKDNIQNWSDDLDAFESALLSSGSETKLEVNNLPYELEYLSVKSELGSFIREWMKKATKHNHSYLRGDITIVNVWKISKNKEFDKLKNTAKSITKTDRETPLHQIHPKMRIDLDTDEKILFSSSGVGMLFHGTRSVNVSGILRESLKMPAQLRGVTITGAMFGPGIYFADDWKKSAGYTSTSGSYWTNGGGGLNNRHAFMFITDVVLGNLYVAPRSQHFSGPPKGTHCIFGKAGHSGVQNNEFIIFDKDQHYLRYLVEFKV